jgi:methionyl aminopeptidase
MFNKQMTVKSEEEIELLRENAIIVSKTLAEVAKYIKPGVSTLALDKIAEDFIRSEGAVPGFKGYRGFPGTLCVSTNEEVVHGIPGNRVLRNGDIVSIDCGCQKDGFFGDSAYTFPVGEVSEEVLNLLKRTKESLFMALNVAVTGRRVGDISAVIQEYVEGFGYSVVRELVGHGIGRQLHEKPDVPNYGRKGSGVKMATGLTICIEPMINMGLKAVVQDSDGWTIRTADRMPSAHFELTVAVRKDKADVLSTFRYIEEVLGSRSI